MMEKPTTFQVEGLLSQPKLYAHLVRWAVEVRQKQLAESKARVIPERQFSRLPHVFIFHSAAIGARALLERYSSLPA
jgi:hypothetical protein